MEISEYRNHGRKPITLPSGLKGFVRAPNLLDMAAYPKLFAGAANGAAGEEEQYALTGEWVHCILRRCFVPERGSMTEKEPGRCLPDELSIHELAPADADAIFTAVTAMQNEAAAPVPGEGAPGGDAFPQA